MGSRERMREERSRRARREGGREGERERQKNKEAKKCRDADVNAWGVVSPSRTRATHVAPPFHSRSTPFPLNEQLGGGPPSCPRPEGMSWGWVGMSSMRHCPGGCRRGPWPCRPPPAPAVVVVVIPLCGLVGTSKGLVVPMFPWSPHCRSTNQPPHKQLLMRLGAGGVLW